MKSAAAAPARHARTGRPDGRPRPAPPSAAGFVARLLAWAVLGLAMIAWLPAITAAAVAHTTRHAAALARLFGAALQVQGDRLVWGSLHLEIVPECTPLVPMVLLASAIAAYPRPFRHRVLGIVAAAPVLWVYNLGRVLLLTLVIAYRPAWFEFVHIYLWQAVTLAVCAGLFAAWLRLGSARPPFSDAASR